MYVYTEQGGGQYSAIHTYSSTVCGVILARLLLRKASPVKAFSCQGPS